MNSYQAGCQQRSRYSRSNPRNSVYAKKTKGRMVTQELQVSESLGTGGRTDSKQLSCQRDLAFFAHRRESRVTYSQESSLFQSSILRNPAPLASAIQVEGQKFQPVVPLDLNLNIKNAVLPSTRAHQAICMKTFQFTKSVFAGRRQTVKDVQVMSRGSPQNKRADVRTRLVAHGSSQPADPSNEGSLLNNASSLLKQNQESSAHNSEISIEKTVQMKPSFNQSDCASIPAPDLLGSESPTVEISRRRNSNAILREPSMSGQAKLDCNGVTAMLELDQKISTKESELFNEIKGSTDYEEERHLRGMLRPGSRKSPDLIKATKGSDIAQNFTASFVEGQEPPLPGKSLKQRKVRRAHRQKSALMMASMQPIVGSQDSLKWDLDHTRQQLLRQNQVYNQITLEKICKKQRTYDKFKTSQLSKSNENGNLWNTSTSMNLSCSEQLADCRNGSRFARRQITTPGTDAVRGEKFQMAIPEEMAQTQQSTVPGTQMAKSQDHSQSKLVLSRSPSRPSLKELEVYSKNHSIQKHKRAISKLQEAKNQLAKLQLQEDSGQLTKNRENIYTVLEYCDQGLEDNYAILPSRENQIESRNNHNHHYRPIHKGLSAGSLGQFNNANNTSSKRFSRAMGLGNTTEVSLDSDDIDQLTKQQKSHFKLSPDKPECSKVQSYQGTQLGRGNSDHRIVMNFSPSSSRAPGDKDIQVDVENLDRSKQHSMASQAKGKVAKKRCKTVQRHRNVPKEDLASRPKWINANCARKLRDDSLKVQTKVRALLTDPLDLNTEVQEHANPAKDEDAPSGQHHKVKAGAATPEVPQRAWQSQVQVNDARTATQTDAIPNCSTSKRGVVIHDKDRRIIVGTQHLSKLNKDVQSSNDDQNDVPSQSLLLNSMNNSIGFASEMINILFTPRAMNCTQAQRRQLQGETRMDAAATIMNMKKEYAIMNQTCQRIVVGPQGAPTINHRDEMQVELTPDAYLVYKCDVGGLVSPLTFQITFLDANDTKYAKLEAYLSATTRKPNKSLHELKFIIQNEFKVKLEDIGKTRVNKHDKAAKKTDPSEQTTGQFEDEFIYLALKAMNGCSITISFSQSDVNKKTQAQLRLEELQRQREETKRNIEEFFSVAEPYYRDMLQMVKQNSTVAKSFRKHQTDCPDRYIFRSDKLKFINSRIAQYHVVKSRKEQMDEDQYNKAVEQLTEWAVLKENRQELFVKYYKAVQVKYYFGTLIKTIYLQKFLAIISAKHKVKLRERMEKEQAIFICLRAKQLFQRRMKPLRGADVPTRTQTLSRNIFTISGVVQYTNFESQAKELFVKYMSEWSWKHKASTGIVVLATKFGRLLHMAHEIWVSMQNRKNVLFNEIWEQEQYRMCQILTDKQQKDSEKVKNEKLWKQIAVIAEHRKQFILQTYWHRQKLQHKISFMKWYNAEQEFLVNIECSACQFSKHYYSYGNALEAYENLLAEIDKFLEKGVDKYKFKERKKKNKPPVKKKQIGQSKTGTVANISAPVKECPQLSVDKKALGKSDAMTPTRGLKSLSTTTSLQPSQPAQPDHDVNDSIHQWSQFKHPHIQVRPKMPEFELLRKDKKDVVKSLMAKTAITKNKEIDTFIETILNFKNDHNSDAEYKPAGHLIDQYIQSIKHIHGYENLAEHLSGDVKDMWITQQLNVQMKVQDNDGSQYELSAWE